MKRRQEETYASRRSAVEWDVGRREGERRGRIIESVLSWNEATTIEDEREEGRRERGRIAGREGRKGRTRRIDGGWLRGRCKVSILRT